MFNIFNIREMFAHFPRHRNLGSEKKTITVRGVDKHLYDQFVLLASLATGNIGNAFSHAISAYKKDTEIIFLPPHIRKIILHPEHKESIELIENQSEIIISKEDLTSAGENVRYVFKKIDKLVFDDTIDNTTLLKYVYRIRNCNVEVLGAISKLFLLSVNQSYSNKLPISKDLKDITIRNVSSTAYDEFVMNCQINKKTIGECVNELLSEIIPHYEILQILAHNLPSTALNPIVLSLHDKIQVTQTDLEELVDRPILFHRIHDLEFSEEIKNDTFIKSVIGIYNCDIVILPSKLPKLIKISRRKRYPENS